MSRSREPRRQVAERVKKNLAGTESGFLSSLRKDAVVAFFSVLLLRLSFSV